ncbi:MAG: hypothetical protein PHY92_10430 [Alphaproteobacteria bacterium]|nr:hypothetical protein [Alphaproteobacteria bacterium]
MRVMLLYRWAKHIFFEKLLEWKISNLALAFQKNFEKGRRISQDLAVFCHNFPRKRRRIVEKGLAVFPEVARRCCNDGCYLAKQLFEACGNDRELKSRCMKDLSSKLSITGEWTGKERKKYIRMLLEACGKDGGLRDVCFDAVLSYVSSLDPEEFVVPSLTAITLPSARKPVRHLAVVPPSGDITFKIRHENVPDKTYPALVRTLIEVLLEGSRGDAARRRQTLQTALSLGPKVASRDVFQGKYLFDEIARSEEGDASLLAGLAGATESGGAVVFSSLRAAPGQVSVYMKDGNGSELIVPNCFGEARPEELLSGYQRRKQGFRPHQHLTDFLATARKMTAKPEELPLLADAFYRRAADYRRRTIGVSSLKPV